MLLNCDVGEDSRVPPARSNQSILKEISLGCLLEGLILKLKFQYFGHLMRRADSKRPWCWERLKAIGEKDDRGWDGWIASPTQWTWVWVDSGSWWWTGRPGMLWFMGSKTVRYNWETELNWWDGWMASPIQWTWLWVNSRSWWLTGRPGVLHFMRWQNQTWLSNWTELN